MSIALEIFSVILTPQLSPLDIMELEDNVSILEDNVSILEDNVSILENNVSILEDNVSIVYFYLSIFYRLKETCMGNSNLY